MKIVIEAYVMIRLPPHYVSHSRFIILFKIVMMLVFCNYIERVDIQFTAKLLFRLSIFI